MDADISETIELYLLGIVKRRCHAQFNAHKVPKSVVHYQRAFQVTMTSQTKWLRC